MYFLNFTARLAAFSSLATWMTVQSPTEIANSFSALLTTCETIVLSIQSHAPAFVDAFTPIIHRLAALFSLV